MDTINELAADERTARIILAIASEPGDTVTGWMIRTVGATDTVARAIGAEVPVGPDGDTWQRRLAPRIDAAQARRVIADSERHAMRVLIPGDPDWPAGIDALGDRAPVALWAKGNTALLAAPVWDRITVTGARASTKYGEHVTTEFTQSAVEDSRQVLSGGAYGIDAAAHRAALASGGSTVAVLAGGLDRLYPAGHTDLLTRVGQEGLLLSELPPGAAPTKWRFPATRSAPRRALRHRARRRGGLPLRAVSTPLPVPSNSATPSAQYPDLSRAPHRRAVTGSCATDSPR